ncbi:hypothetical protein Tco_0093433 [Tanacetum coccineum]
MAKSNVHLLVDNKMSYEGPSNTKENRIMDIKLEYNTFRTKEYESLSQAYTYYKTLLNELSNDDVKLSIPEINVGFVNSLCEEAKLLTREMPESKKALITTPITIAFFSNNIVHDFQENYDDEVDERTSDEYLMNLDIEFLKDPFCKIGHYANDCFSKTYVPSYKSSVLNYSLGSGKFQPKYSNDKHFQTKIKALSLKHTMDEEEVSSNNEQIVQVKVLMALAEDEPLVVG